MDRPELAPQRWDTDPGEVIKKRIWRANAPGDIDQDRGRARAPANAPLAVDELTDSLVTRPGEPETISFRAETPACLRDRNAPVIEANESLAEAVRNPRREAKHGTSFAVEEATVRDDSAPKYPSNSLLLGWFAPALPRGLPAKRSSGVR